jgi:hypothetical protein
MFFFLRGKPLNNPATPAGWTELAVDEVVRNDVKLKEKSSLVRKLAPEYELKLLARKNPRC